ncbi:MAG TPA: nucleotide pyrophosphatase/phosphodiesterase family protein [Streptosporangiaceae bacterium]|nr:nucleotide pyrophosphatase/phosphodiesterase family protein [Streptosporangiaceae bacterium]
MTDEPMAPPVLPNYNEGTLPDLATSLLAALGARGEANPLGLPRARRICLLVVDGLGWELLRDHPAAAPFLSELALSARPLTAGFPATTVTSLTSLGTGRPPGQHGLLGYQVRVPGREVLLNGLRWNADVDPVVWQPKPTVYERAAKAGIDAFRVAGARLEKTGLSKAAMRGNSYRPANSLGGLVAQAAGALRESSRTLVSVYHGQLDSTGHAFGCRSDAWRYELGHVDKLAEQLAGSLPEATTMYVTADHGMVDVLPEDRIDADTVPGMRDGVDLLGGEPRARHVYTAAGAADDVLAAWREILSERAWVLSREEAIAAGWFGPVDPALADRIGDVVAAPIGGLAIVASKAEPLESALIGMHGSLTAADQFVPLLMHASA